MKYNTFPDTEIVCVCVCKLIYNFRVNYYVGSQKVNFKKYTWIAMYTHNVF